MKVTAWEGGTYGIKIRKKDVKKYFDSKWKYIDVEIDGQWYRFKLTKTFWTTCPEFRGHPIPKWLFNQGLANWPKGNPPEFELIPLGGNKFRLTKGKCHRVMIAPPS